MSVVGYNPFGMNPFHAEIKKSAYRAEGKSYDVEPKTGFEGQYTSVRWMDNTKNYQYQPHGGMGWTPTTIKSANAMVDYLKSEIRTDSLGKSTKLEHGIKFQSLGPEDGGNSSSNSGGLGDDYVAPNPPVSENATPTNPLIIYGGLGVAALALFAFLRR